MSTPRPLPRVRPCLLCGGARFLRVAPVREHGNGGDPIAMAATYVLRERDLGPFARAVQCVGPKVAAEPAGTFTVLICTDCGDTRWFVRDLAVEIAVDLAQAALGGCTDCGDARASRLGRAKTRGHGGAPSELRVLSWTSRRWGFSTQGSAGHFDTFACRGCERVTWIAGGLDLRAQRSSSATACARCSATARFVVEPVNEDGATLRVLYDRQHLRELRVGNYALSICAGCGVTDWTARDIEALEADPHLGVGFIAADSDGNDGPYR